MTRSLGMWTKKRNVVEVNRGLCAVMVWALRERSPIAKTWEFKRSLVRLPSSIQLVEIHY